MNKPLDKRCDLAIQQAIPNKQIALMTEASVLAARYAVFIEADPNQKLPSLRTSYAPVSYGAKTFISTQIKRSYERRKLERKTQCKVTHYPTFPLVRDMETY